MKKSVNIILLLLVTYTTLYATGNYPTARGKYDSNLSILLPNRTVVFNGNNSYDNDTQNHNITPQWQWDFNYVNGIFTTDITSSSAIISHVYTQAGTYTVAVKYKDNDGWWSGIYTFQVEIAEYKRYYYLKDHLGNIRITVDGEKGSDGKAVVAGYDDYYPFGMVMSGRSGNIANPNSIYKFTGKERDDETQYDYFGARFYDSRIGRWLSVDPLADKYPGWSPYNYVLNNPLSFIDPDGQEPVKNQAGTVSTFIKIFNNTPSKMGTLIGSSAANALLRLGESSGLTPKTTPYFNNREARYIYTEKGGWIDMVHFLFYAGKAYSYKNNGEKNPIGEAVQDGYQQEFIDQFTAKHSAYSYEDLPTDKFGADFAVNYFDPKVLCPLANNYLII